jgi:hypothetical protein
VFDLEKPDGGMLDLSSEAVLVPGAIGGFDDSGASMGCFAQRGSELRMHYLGWNLGVTVPWRNSIGLAISRDGELNFEKHSAAPLLDRSPVDPFSISCPWVFQRGLDDWLMWYGSNLTWGTGKKQEEMAHLIKFAHSKDGIHWRREGRIALAFRHESEYAMSKPTVVKDGDLFRMWYSFRGPAYRIGYAESLDDLEWMRLDERAGISVSDDGWDSETVEYPVSSTRRVRDGWSTTVMAMGGQALGWRLCKSDFIAASDTKTPTDLWLRWGTGLLVDGETVALGIQECGPGADLSVGKQGWRGGATKARNTK